MLVVRYLLSSPLLPINYRIMVQAVESGEGGGGADLTDEDVIPNTPSLVTFSSRGYIKRMPVSTWDVQKRGGKGACHMHVVGWVCLLVCVLHVVACCCYDKVCDQP